MNPYPYIHRKEIASLLHVSTETVRRHEHQWEISAALDPRCLKPRRYHRDHPAIRKLIGSAVESQPPRLAAPLASDSSPDGTTHATGTAGAVRARLRAARMATRSEAHSK